MRPVPPPPEKPRYDSPILEWFFTVMLIGAVLFLMVEREKKIEKQKELAEIEQDRKKQEYYDQILGGKEWDEAEYQKIFSPQIEGHHWW